MKSSLILALSLFLAGAAYCQSITGTWQLVREANCPETQLEEGDEAALLADMKSMSGASPQIVRFREKGTGEESTRILGKRKSANSRNFLYKVDNDALYILDKRSQTISESFLIDRISSDSLVLSNAGRPCEMRIFVKIREEK